METKQIALISVIIFNIIPAILSTKVDWKKYWSPYFQPPSSIFGLMWTIIYTFIAFAFALIVRSTPNRSISSILDCDDPSKTSLCILLVFNLLLNYLWIICYAFLDKSYLPLTVVIMINLVISLLVLMVASWWAECKMSCMLLIPYFSWLIYASILNVAVLQIENGPHKKALNLLNNADIVKYNERYNITQ